MAVALVMVMLGMKIMKKKGSRMITIFMTKKAKKEVLMMKKILARAAKEAIKKLVRPLVRTCGFFLQISLLGQI